MSQNYITPPAPLGAAPLGAEQWTSPLGPAPAWYGWPPPWYGSGAALAASPPVPPEPPGGVRKLAYSVEEAAEALGVSRSLVYQLIHQSGFPSVKLRGRRLISAELLAEWMRQQAGGGFF